MVSVPFGKLRTGSVQNWDTFVFLQIFIVTGSVKVGHMVTLHYSPLGLCTVGQWALRAGGAISRETNTRWVVVPGLRSILFPPVVPGQVDVHIIKEKTWKMGPRNIQKISTIKH